MTLETNISDIRLQKIVSTDHQLLRQVEDIAREIWIEHYSPIVGIDQVNYMLHKFQSKEAMKQQITDGYQYSVVWLDKELVGYYSVLPKENELFLSKIYLTKGQRGRGIFSIMLAQIVETAKTLNKQCISLTVNKYNANSIEVYKFKGFKVTREAVFDIGNNYVMDDYVLQKDI